MIPVVSIDFDMSAVSRLSADLTSIDGRLARHINPVIKKGAQNIKEAMISDLNKSSNAGFRAVARSVSYDMRTAYAFGGGEIAAEIGPTSPDGALENIAYFGSWKGGGTVRDPVEALADEEPDFVREIEKLAEELI